MLIKIFLSYDIGGVRDRKAEHVTEYLNQETRTAYICSVGKPFLSG